MSNRTHPPIGSTPIPRKKTEVTPDWVAHPTNPLLEIDKNSGRLRTKPHLAQEAIDQYYGMKKKDSWK